MARAHRVTHPVLGQVTWDEIKVATDALRRRHNAKLCSWCHVVIPPGRRRTQCGKSECSEMIWRASQYTRTVTVVLRRDKHVCRLCLEHAWEGQVDHIIPVSLGGLGDINNLRYLCLGCHKLETARLRYFKLAFVALSAVRYLVSANPYE